jgi:hypothetical protein
MKLFSARRRAFERLALEHGPVVQAVAIEPAADRLLQMNIIVPLLFSFFWSKWYLQSFNCGMRNVMALAVATLSASDGGLGVRCAA